MVKIAWIWEVFEPHQKNRRAVRATPVFLTPIRLIDNLSAAGLNLCYRKLCVSLLQGT
jgi:hypothetical protein